MKYLTNLKSIALAVGAAIFFTLSGWLGDAFQPYVINIGRKLTSVASKNPVEFVATDWSLSGLVLLLILWFGVFYFLKATTGFNVRYHFKLDTDGNQHRAIVCAVFEGVDVKEMENGCFRVSWRGNDEPLIINPAETKLADLLDIKDENKFSKNNFSHLLRAIQNNEEHLEYLVLLSSPKSNINMKMFKPFIQAYYPKLKIQMHDKEIDFENPDIVTIALKKEVKKLNNLGVENHDVLLDITGGMKPTSAAFVTFAMTNKMHYQYITFSGESLVYECQLSFIDSGV